MWPDLSQLLGKPTSISYCLLPVTAKLICVSSTPIISASLSILLSAGKSVHHDPPHQNCPYQPTLAFALSSDFPDSQSSWAVLILHFCFYHSAPLNRLIICSIWSISFFGFYDKTLPLVFSVSLKKPFLLVFVICRKVIQADSQRPSIIILILLSKYRVNTVSVNIYGMLVNFWSILKSFDYYHYFIVLYGGSVIDSRSILTLHFPQKMLNTSLVLLFLYQWDSSWNLPGVTSNFILKL